MRWARALALLAAQATAVPAWGAAALLQGEDASLSLGGYARSLAGLQRLSFATSRALPPGPLPDHDGAATTVLRLEWKAALGDRFSAEIHQRLYLRLESATLAFGGQKMGIGASVVPRRSVDLRSVIYDEDRLLLEHDVDALALRANLGDVDVVLGRQAISWGVGALFPVADLWTGFSPFELDTTQKRGIDALRLLFSRGRSLEIEVVVADRGTPRDLSGGLRIATYGAWADLYLAVAKQWRELIAFTGASVPAGSFKLRAEVAAPFDLDGGEWTRPRVSLGVDWLLSTLTLTLEGHFNGTGVQRISDYLVHQGSPVVQRGESYLLGRWYAGAAASWKLSELFQLTITALCNVYDPSWALAGAFTYRVTQGTELSLGAYQGVGRIPRIFADPAGAGLHPRLGSEFGSAGGVYYLGLSTFF
jgi:hypothetical protein